MSEAWWAGQRAEGCDVEGVLIDVQAWVFARAPFSGASVSGQPLPNLIHPLDPTNDTTRHTPILATLATRATLIATDRALPRLLL